MRMALLPFGFLLGLLFGLLLLTLSIFDWSVVAQPWIKTLETNIQTIETNIQTIVNADENGV